jgi:hypothetical protein
MILRLNVPVGFELSVEYFILALELIAKVIKALHPNYRQIKQTGSNVG